jgi:peptidyl-prolyl cis-trans isomerase SurA
LIDDNWKDGLSQETNKDGKIIFVNVRKIVPPENKSFSEVRGIVTTDYQNYLMNQWVADLRAKYPVTVNKGVEKMVLSAQ